jgi:inhibitor of KinA sporulation pathway (predicted exonuclease)
MTDPRFYLVIDLEATTSDDGSLPPEQMETVEIGAVLVDARTLEPVVEFQSFVQPVRHPKLLPFCTKLTGITRAMVDDAPRFPEAFAALRAKLIDHRHPLLFCSWGRYDRIQLERDCALHGILNNMPEHVNLKTRFTDVQGIKKKLGMAQALKLCGLPLEGAHHRGIDDARNIARMLPWIVGNRRVGRVRFEPADQHGTQALRPHVDKVLAALGHPDGFATDESRISDFLEHRFVGEPKWVETPRGRRRSVKMVIDPAGLVEAVEKLGLPIEPHERVVDVALRLRSLGRA